MYAFVMHMYLHVLIPVIHQDIDKAAPTFIWLLGFIIGVRGNFSHSGSVINAQVTHG